MKTGLRVFTAQYSYNGEERFDTTVKTGHNFVAPTWDIVLGHKRDQITDLQYVQQYLHMLDHSMNVNPDQWINVFRRRKIVLVCFCGTAKCFCHRYPLALVLEKFGAKYMGEINTRTNVLIPRDRFLDKVLDATTLAAIQAYEFKKNSAETIEPLTNSRKMVVDPLTINTIQSSVCRQCRDNRSAMAWTPKGNVTIPMYDKATDEELGSRNMACCAMDFDESARPVYKCGVFPQLIDGYNAGVTSQGTNINPCKHCPEHVDNHGRCFGDRCPDGPFPTKEGAGLVKC